MVDDHQREELLELCRTNPEAVVDIREHQDRLISQLNGQAE